MRAGDHENAQKDNRNLFESTKTALTLFAIVTGAAGVVRTAAEAGASRPRRSDVVNGFCCMRSKGGQPGGGGGRSMRAGGRHSPGGASASCR